MAMAATVTNGGGGGDRRGGNNCGRWNNNAVANAAMAINQSNSCN